MQNSYWIAFLRIIMFSLKSNSPNAEPVKTPDPRIPVTNVPLYSLRGTFLKETNMKKKNIYIINMQLST